MKKVLVFVLFAALAGSGALLTSCESDAEKAANELQSEMEGAQKEMQQQLEEAQKQAEDAMEQAENY